MPLSAFFGTQPVAVPPPEVVAAAAQRATDGLAACGIHHTSPVPGHSWGSGGVGPGGVRFDAGGELDRIRGSVVHQLAEQVSCGV